MSESKKISVRFSADEFEEIEQEAEQRGAPLSFIVKDRLEQWSKMQRIGIFDTGDSATATSQFQEVIDLLTPLAKRQERIQDQVVDLQTSYTALSAQYVELLQQNNVLTAQVGLATEQGDLLSEQVGQLNQQNHSLLVQIDNLEKHVNASSETSNGSFQRLFSQGLPIIGGFNAEMFRIQAKRLEVIAELTLKIAGIIMIDTSPADTRAERREGLRLAHLEIDKYFEDGQSNGHCN